MIEAVGRRKLLKTMVFGVLLVLMCVLTSICRAEIQVGASEVRDEPVVTRSNEDTDTTNDYLEGDLGGLTFRFDGDNTSSLSATLQILLILTIISLAPSILIMLTSFTRIVIVLHFVRTAVGTQTTPPNQVLVGLTLFLTFFIMNPVITQINDTAVKPFEAGEMTQTEFVETAVQPLREFMYPQTQTKDVRLFMDIAKIESVESIDDIPTRVLVPAFVISELRRAFIIGFLIYIPFIIIDMVVASTLMSMGMMMLPPTTISMPFKVLLFVLADGWNLVIGNLVRTFY